MGCEFPSSNDPLRTSSGPSSGGAGSSLDPPEHAAARVKPTTVSKWSVLVNPNILSIVSTATYGSTGQRIPFERSF